MEWKKKSPLSFTTVNPLSQLPAGLLQRDWGLATGMKKMIASFGSKVNAVPSASYEELTLLKASLR